MSAQGHAPSRRGAQRQAAALVELGHVLERAQDPDTVAQRVAQSVQILCKSRSVGLYRLEPSSGDLFAIAFAGDRGDDIPYIRAGIGTTGAALREGRPIATPDPLSDPSITLTPELRARIERVGGRAVLAVPLRAQERLIGALTVRNRGGHIFDEDEIRLVQTFADLSALALENARLFTEGERRRTEAEIFAGVARSITATLDLDTALQHIATAAKDLTRSDQATIGLWDPSEGAVFVRYWASTRDQRFSGARLESGKGAGGLVLRTGVPFRTDHYATDPRITKDYLGGIEAAGVVAQLVVPILGEAEIEGLIYVENETPRLFTDRDEVLLRRLADHAAISIRNTRLLAAERTARSVAEESERALRQREAQYRHLIEGSIQGVYVHSGFVIRLANQALAHIHGYDTTEELIGTELWCLIAPYERQRLEGYAAARRRGETAPARYEYQGVRKDGSLIWVENLVSMTTWNDEPAYLATVMDISERRQSEVALRESEARTALILETALDAVVSMDARGLIIGWNSQAEKIFGWARHEALGQPLMTLIIPLRHRDAHERGLRHVLATGEGPILNTRVELIALHRDEREFPVELTVSMARVSDATTFNAFVRDLTERKAAEAALRQGEQQARRSQKMEAIGQLAGGIAHDFNNLLTIIGARNEMVAHGLSTDDPLRRNVLLIKQTAERATALVRQLLAFSRSQPLEPAILDLNAVVSDMLKMLPPLIGEAIHLTFTPAGGLGRVRADRGQLEQVLLNLAVNARDAMPHGGQLTIATANVDVDGSFTASHPELLPGSYVTLLVRDTGCGITPEVQARVFEPFFTTKDRGRGTGLGLSIVYGIVKQSEGDIVLESAPGQGSAFRIYLPRRDEGAEPDAPVVASARGGTETILLVEDETEVRLLAEEVLESAGYTVLEARHPGEALLIGERYSGRIDLLLTDMMMPEMNGRELADRLRALRPGLRVLFMSGYSDTTIVSRDGAGGATMFLAKPFTPSLLGSRVRKILD